MYKRFLVILVVLALASLACGINFNIPVSDIKTGPLQTDQISIPAPGGSTPDVTLSFGAGNLKVAPGAQEVLIEGVANYNVQQFKPVTTVNGNQVKLDTGNLEIKGFPRISNDIKNDWDLKLGSQLMSLHINAGAYKGNYELGGLSLNYLEVTDGAADVGLNFSQPNLVEMSEFRYVTGASTVRLSGLANANFKSMLFRSGAGSYTLDFSGQLQRDALITVESGVSQLTIIVPEGLAAQLTFRGGLSNVSTHGAWQKSGSEYDNAGVGPKLTITVDMGAGSIDLQNTP